MKKTILILFVFIISTLNCLAVSVPNLNMLCTKSDPDFKEIWHGFPKCNRNVPYWVKSWIYEQHGIPDSERYLYTVDHVLALALGGSNHADNLNPQLRSESTAKLEYQLYLKLRNGELGQQEAIDILLDAKGYL